AVARLGHRRADRQPAGADRQAGDPAPDAGDHRAGDRAQDGLRPRRAARRGLYRGAVMTARAGRVLLAVLALFALSAQRDPILVPEVSQHEVQVRQGFTGTELLLFGAILDPQGRRASQPYDVV